MIVGKPKSTTPPKPPLALPLSHWPAGDQAAWLAALSPEDPFSSSNPARGWRPATLCKVKYDYGYWLGWLSKQNLLDPNATPGSRVSRDRAREYLVYLRASGLKEFSICSILEGLSHALRALVPDQDWRWIARAADRLARRARPARDKASRLQSPLKLIALGEQLMTQAESTGGPVRTMQAMDFRDGLLIAFLAYRPIRRKNLTEMVIGQHLVNRNGCWWVRFTAAETKSVRPLEFPFPAELTPFLERYIGVFRPALLASGRGTGRGTDGLWVSIRGRQMADDAIFKQVKLRTRAAFGQPIALHMFRDACATWIAMFDPSHVRIIAAILGHATLRTGERHYNQARNLEAAENYHAVLEGIRGPAKPGRRLVSQEPTASRGDSSDRHAS